MSAAETGEDTEAAFKDSLLLFFASEIGVLEIVNCRAAAEDEADVAETEGESDDEEGVYPVVDVTLSAPPRRFAPLVVPPLPPILVGVSPLVPELTEQQLKNEVKKFPTPLTVVDEDDVVDEVEADLLILLAWRCC